MEKIKDTTIRVALLNTISEVTAKLIPQNSGWRKVSKAAKRIAELTAEGYTDNAVITIMFTEGYFTEDEVKYLLSIEER